MTLRPARKAIRYPLFFALGIVVLSTSVSGMKYLVHSKDSVVEPTATGPFYESAGGVASPRAVGAEGSCSPLGDPIDGSRYKGNNAFYLCKEGEHFNTASWGQDNVELFIACRESSLRKDWKWHIWCNADGSNCGCNRTDFINGEKSCCQWTAGAHCTANGGARPGQNGCASW
jgi:hypothetical protein